MKKESRVQKILMLILSFTLLTTSLLASTISRYVSEEKAPFGEDEHLDYTVNSVFVVKNQEELFAAVNQGYTYVQLDPQIENPLIVTQKAENLDADLILDLNGIEIQRNGYEPILNVKKGVRLTIVDTSAEQTGGLYNPVGSVFNITGGTLTVVTGTFESGPRYSEYYSYNTDVLSTSDPTKRTLVENSAKKVCFYKKTTNPDKTWTFSDPTELNAPIIKSYPEKIGNVEYTHGNLYFDQTITKGDLTINPDTYCYYRTSEDKAAEVNNEAAADWYYTYFVDPNNKFEYAAATVDPSEEENYVKITIYGYENTIKQAAADKDPKDYYAAIQMQDGTLDVQNGGFYSYFGVDKTACVNAQKGDLKIKKGKFSSRIPNATIYNANSVVIKEPDEKAFEETYFDNYHWSSDAVGATYRGNLARQGESYCILNGGSANVTIGTGDLYSSNNGIINMQGGELSISGGTFYKRLTNGRVTVDESEMSAIYMSQGELDISNAKCYVLRNDSLNVDSDDKNEDAHAIYMRNGILNVTDTTYHMEGDNSIGVKMESGKLAVTGGACEILGSNTYGIYSTVEGDENFHVNNTSFSLQGDSSTGIYAERGRVNVLSDSSSQILIEGKAGRGIHVAIKGSVDSVNYAYTLNGDESIGILAENSAESINVENGDISIVGATSFGIKSSIASNAAEDNFTVTNSSIVMSGGGANQTGIYSAFGKVIVNASTAETISTSGNNGKGIHVLDNGSVVSTNYSYSLNGSGSIGIFAEDDATGINVTNGEMSIIGSNAFGIQSSIRGDDKFTVTNLPIIMDGASSQTGIYSSGGKVIVNAIGESKTISTNGSYSKGIHVASGGSVVSTNYNYSLTGSESIGILAQADATGINVTNGKMDIKGYRSFGIHSSISGTNTFTVTNVPISMTDGEEQTGIYAQNGRVNISAGSSTTISIDDNNGKGVHVGSGGSVVSSNYSYSLNGDNSYGIYSTGGLVKLTGGDITLTSNQSCYGVYAFSATEEIQIDITGSEINVGYDLTTNRTTDTRASVGVFLATSSNANKITLTDANIRCYDAGVLIDGGSLDIKSTSDAKNEILTKESSSIIIKGGNITFDSTCKYIISSSNTRTFTGSENTNTLNTYDENLYSIQIPELVGNDINYVNYANTDGIYVEGGNFTSYGDVEISHTGLCNDISKWTYYDDITITSFAVRVIGGQVNLQKANISASVGGGVMCNGGNVTLGNASSKIEDITIRTTGSRVLGTSWKPVSGGADGTWSRYKTYTGGHAMEIVGGNLEVFEGTYYAAHGDGIKLNAPQYISGDKTKVTVHNGDFNGQMENDLNGNRSGPAGCYGMKVYGPAILNIYNGTFNGRAGGACVGGVYDYEYRSNGSIVKYDLAHKAEVYIYQAHFGTTSVPNDGFMIYDNSKIIFGASKDPNIAKVDSITVNSNLAPFSVNWITFDTYTGHDKDSCDVRVYYGTYKGSYHGWNKSNQASDTFIYNARNSIGLTVRQFTTQTGAEAITDLDNITLVYYPGD